MTLKEFISKAKIKTTIELLENNNYLCDTTSDSKVLEIYGERKVIHWLCNKLTKETYKAVITVNIEGECSE